MSQYIIQAEESLIIETPERVPLEFSLASIGNRFLAVAVDHVLQFLAMFTIAWFLIAVSDLPLGETAEETLTTMPGWLFAATILLVFFIFASYFIIFEWLWNGQTPGKRMMKLRVIREDGRPVTLWEAIARNLIRIADAMPGFIIPIYSVGLITAFLNSRDQRLGDIFAGTVVIRERTDEAPTFRETFSSTTPDLAYARFKPTVEFSANLAGVSDPEIEVAETFLRRRLDLTDKQREWMAWRIALPLMFKLKPKYDLAEFTYEGFLEELVHRVAARRSQLN